MTPKLAAATWVNALQRRVGAAGGFVTVLRRGDETAGAVILVTRDRDGTQRAFSRVVQSNGAPAWSPGAVETRDGPETIEDFLARQRRYDPDLWVVELDIADPQRFVDEPMLDG
jgi:hypothetical protein